MTFVYFMTFLMIFKTFDVQVLMIKWRDAGQYTLLSPCP